MAASAADGAAVARAVHRRDGLGRDGAAAGGGGDGGSVPGRALRGPAHRGDAAAAAVAAAGLDGRQEDGQNAASLSAGQNNLQCISVVLTLNDRACKQGILL